MNLVFVSAEVAPWSKTGGLGEVCGSLPRALAGRGHRVLTVSPRYKPYEDAWDTGIRARAYLFGMTHEVRYFHAERGGCHHLFVDHPAYLRPGIYGDSQGPYGDNLFRFALLCRAGIEAAATVPVDGAPLGEDVVFHANDWHAALLPLYLQATMRPAGRFERARTVLGLHNVGHQGTQSANLFPGLDVSSRWWPALDMDGNLNPLKCGVVLAERLVAVSPTYALEVCGELGFGLGGLLSARGAHLSGILNGVDPSWDPANDAHLAARFSADDLSGKAVAKRGLQQELGLPPRDVPLLALISRLDHQKGVDLVQAIAPWLLARDVQLVMLGSGDPRLERWFRESEAAWPDRVRGWVGYNEPLAHRVEAGADIFLMPSRFEPCGLNQMYSMRYGTVPVVHATGGLADTVQTYDPTRGTGTGWAFHPFSAEAFREAVGRALHTFTNEPEAWLGLQRRGMAIDFSWNASAARYEQLYAELLGPAAAAG